MTSFKEVLDTLPAVDHLSAIEILHADEVLSRLENKPGQAGSVRVYHALYQEFGALDAVAADKGLRLYAEHTADAVANPGKHPNIDRLLTLAEGGQAWAVRLVMA